ncbi:MAG: benzoate-CoA ligase family protein [Xanthobacteraceae bacterium]
MVKGVQIDFSLPEHLNLGSYYLDVNLEQGRGDKIAIYYKDGTYTFRDLSRLTDKFGNVLRALGVEPENRVLLALEDSPEWVAAWLATMKIGAVGTHAYTYLATHDYAYLLNLIRPKVAVVDGVTLERMREASRQRKYPTLFLVAGDTEELCKGEISLQAMLESADERLDVASTHRDDPAFWNFSGGTTGKPKGVPHMHRDGVVAYESFNNVVSYTSDDIVLRVPKLFFHYARDLGLLFPLRNGAAVVLYEGRTTAASIFNHIRKYRPTVLLNVPTMMKAMVQTPDHGRADLSGIRVCLSSGEQLSAQLYRDWVKAFGIEVVNRFGSAESGIGYLCNRPGEVKPGSSGRVNPLVEVKLVDEVGREVANGQPGVLLVRSDAVGSHYVREHEKSRATFLGDEWINTGDVFIQDENDYFWYVGRANEMIKVSGVWVSPLEIEQVLQEYPSVKECAAVAMKGEDGLMSVKAFVVLHERGVIAARMADDLKQFCKQRLAPHKFPQAIEFVEALPKTGAGKIDRLLMRMHASVPT